MIRDSVGSTRRRPGPFGPARDLLPEAQSIETIRDSEPVSLALERLADSGYDQFPVIDKDNRVVGVFSWKSFGRRMSEIHTQARNLATIPVIHTELDAPRFLDPDTYIDTETDWKLIDYVLVGNTEHLLGVLTLTDIYGRLNDFAEAFVLLFEIEHEIRDLFRDLFPGEAMKQLLAELSDSSGEPEVQAAEALNAIVESDPPLVIDAVAHQRMRGAAVQLNRVARARVRRQEVSSLEDFTFSQYRGVIFDGDHWPRFESVFSRPREFLLIDFERVNALRNDVFHFRRGIGPRDTDRLRRFRDMLRYDRDMYLQQQAEGNSAGNILARHPR
jgi:CBS domain-containing protein